MLSSVRRALLSRGRFRAAASLGLGGGRNLRLLSSRRLGVERWASLWSTPIAGSRGAGRLTLVSPLRRARGRRACSSRANLNDGAAESAVSTKVQMREAVETGKNYTILFVIGGITLGFGFTIIQYMLPSGSSPNAVFNDACATLESDETLADVVGKPYHFFGADRHSSGREGRRNRVDSFTYKDPSENDMKYTRIKFNVAGRHGNAICYAEKSAAMGSGQFNYLILEAPQRKHIWTIVNEQKKVSLAQLQGDVVELLQQYPNSKEEVVLYGSSRCKWTKRQLMELGVEGMKNIKVVDCDKDQPLCRRQQIRSLPTWKITIPTEGGKPGQGQMVTIQKCELVCWCVCVGVRAQRFLRCLALSPLHAYSLHLSLFSSPHKRSPHGGAEQGAEASERVNRIFLFFFFFLINVVSLQRSLQILLAYMCSSSIR